MDKQEELCVVPKNCFYTLFTIIQVYLYRPLFSIIYVPLTIAEQDNDMLLAPFSMEEFRKMYFK
jgi:hypothetical protein